VSATRPAQIRFCGGSRRIGTINFSEIWALPGSAQIYSLAIVISKRIGSVIAGKLRPINRKSPIDIDEKTQDVYAVGRDR